MFEYSWVWICNNSHNCLQCKTNRLCLKFILISFRGHTWQVVQLTTILLSFKTSENDYYFVLKEKMKTRKLFWAPLLACFCKWEEERETVVARGKHKNPRLCQSSEAGYSTWRKQIRLCHYLGLCQKGKSNLQTSKIFLLLKLSHCKINIFSKNYICCMWLLKYNIHVMLKTCRVITSYYASLNPLIRLKPYIISQHKNDGTIICDASNSENV